MRVFHESLSICVCASFSFGFENGMWDLLYYSQVIAYLFTLNDYDTMSKVEYNKKPEIRNKAEYHVHIFLQTQRQNQKDTYASHNKAILMGARQSCKKTEMTTNMS